MVARTYSVPELGRQNMLPWSFLIFRRSPWRASITGVAIAVALAAVMVALELLSGRPQRVLAGENLADVGCVYLSGDYRIGFIGILLLAYTATARYILTQWTNEAASSLSVDDFTDAESLAEQRWWGFLPGLLGAMLTFSFGIDIAERQIEWTPDYWILPHIFNWGWCLPFGWVAGRLFYSVPTNALLISRIARSIDVPDLEHTVPLDMTITHGLRSALLSLIFLGLVSVHFVDPGTGIVAAGVLFVLFIFGIAISSVPMFGAVAELHNTRDDQVARVRNERAEEEARLMRNDGSHTAGRVADLVALEQHLQQQRISVFRLSYVARLLLYAGIGLLSWLGAAAVSVWVEKLLGV